MVHHFSSVILLFFLSIPGGNLDGFVDNLSNFVDVFSSVTNQTLTYNTFKSLSSLLIDYEVNLLRSKYATTQDTAMCFDDMRRLVSGFLTGEKWALQTFDSWGKFGNGIFEGYVFVRGGFSLCMKSHPERDPSLPDYSNHFCWMDLNNKFWRIGGRGFRIGICVPKTCSQPMVLSALQKLQGLIRRRPPYLPYLYVPMCYSENHSDHFSNPQEASSIIICLIIIGLVLLGTLYDLAIRLSNQSCCIIEVEKPPQIYKLASEKDIRGQLNKESMMFSIDEDNESEKITNDSEQALIPAEEPSSTPVREKNICKPNCCERCLLAFSAITNMEKLFEIKANEGQLDCLHGIRVLSIGSVVMSHTLSHLFPGGDNVVGVYEMTTHNYSGTSVLVVGYFAVDSFFVMSGMLLTYLFMRNREKGKKLNWLTWIKFYVDRFVRLSPANWFMLFILYWGILTYNPQGPADVYGPGVQKTCSDSWWYYILYINNFLTKECFGIDWYLGDDMQFYWISPIFLLFFMKIGAWTAIIMFGVTAASVGISLKILLQYRYLDYYYLIYKAREYPHLAVLGSNMYYLLYIRPYCRIGAYLIGMYFGWLLFRIKCSAKLPKIAVLTMWCFGLSCILVASSLCLFVKLSDLAIYIFVSMHHYIWSIGLAVIIFLCCVGYGGIFNSVMAWPGWLPLSRLSYSVYVIHFIAMKLFYFNTEERFHVTVLDTYIHFTSLIQWDFAAALLLHLAIEAPFINLKKALIG